MSYQVLARKWRPKIFTEMIGQSPTVRMLANALDQKRLHHAYLFTGTRGVGKTTIARIFAKSLNCVEGLSSTPCGACAHCQSIDAGTFLDLYEVDAASRTKVEDTRELLENISYPPSQGRYKVYLIDEVHMLSNHSFNALLKTLEEPPAHVKFILATTDPKKLPATILSRCLQFHLKRLSLEVITEHLKHICAEEKLAFEENALLALAHAADGSMRDALSLLDQAIAFCHGSINITDVKGMLGNLSQADILPLLEALTQEDAAQLFAAIETIKAHGVDFDQVLQDVIDMLHQMAIFKILPSYELSQALKTIAEKLSDETIQLFYQIALLGRRDLMYTPTPAQGFEMIMLRMLAFQPQPAPVRTTHETHAVINHEPEPATKEAPQVEATLNWREVLPKLKLTGLAQVLAANCSFIKFMENRLELALGMDHQPMFNPKLKERLNEALNQYFQRDIQLDIKITREAPLNTPSKQMSEEKAKKLAQAKAQILEDPKVKKMIEIYDATVEVSLLS